MSNVLDIIGPVMIGPSSSHTAGAARLGLVSRMLLGADPKSVRVTLYGSFAKTYRGHGTDRALVAGALGLHADDVRLRDSLDLARERGVEVSFVVCDDEDEGLHPNTALIELASAEGKRLAVLGSSIGGGQVEVTRVDGMRVRITGLKRTLIVRHTDKPGLIACVTDVLAAGGANICDFALARQERGGVAVMSIEVENQLDDDIAERIERLDGVERCTVLEPVGAMDATEPAKAGEVPATDGLATDFLLGTLEPAVEAAENAGVPISHVILAQQARAMEMAPAELYALMRDRLAVMNSCVAPGSDPSLRSMSGLTGGDAARMLAREAAGRPLCGGIVTGAVRRALAVSELNAAMGRVVAAPTAGSCGILPAAVLSMRDERGRSEGTCVMALFTAAAVGLVIEHAATLAGAEGGCQAETGAAAAMAAAAVTELAGGTPRQCASAASMSIQSLLGLVCVPVAGLVEVPCVRRNATGVSVALTCAEMALAGISATIPFDEAVTAMRRVGVLMPSTLRETGEGGLAATPTGRALAEKAFGGCAACGACR